MSDQKPSRQERFARCFDAISAYLRSKEPNHHLVPGWWRTREEDAMYAILEFTQLAMASEVRGDVLDHLEECEKAAAVLKEKR